MSHHPIIVVDGAHNPAGVARLVQTWRDFLAGSANGYSAGGSHLVFAAVADKSIAEMARLLAPLARRVSLVRLANERTLDPADLVAHFPGLPGKLYGSVAELGEDLKNDFTNDPVLVAGSLFLAGEYLAYREGRTGEYQMNERLETSAVRR